MAKSLTWSGERHDLAFCVAARYFSATCLPSTLDVACFGTGTKCSQHEGAAVIGRPIPSLFRGGRAKFLRKVSARIFVRGGGWTVCRVLQTISHQIPLVTSWGHLMKFLVLTLLSALLFSSAQADDWNQFRGPTGNATVAVAGTPADFEKSATLWKTAIPGTGWSSPVIGDGKIWLTTAEVQPASPEQIAKKREGVEFAQIKTVAGAVRLRAICVDADTGKIVHNVLLRNVTDPELINPLNSYASPTPAISGNRVICHFGSYGTWCLNSNTAETIWDTALVIDHSVGPGSSPIIADNVVLIVCDGIDKQFVTGLHLATGKEKWTTPRPPIRAENGEFRKAYSTPLLITVDGEQQAVIPGAQWMCAYNPGTGEEIWRADCGSGFSTTPMAVEQDGLVICSTGFMKPELVAINPSGSGDISESNIVWRTTQGGSTMPTAVAADGLVYAISDKGILTVLNATNGDVVSRQRIGGKFASSPLLTTSMLYLGSQEGVMTVLDLKTMKPLARNSMDSDLMASPAVLGSDLIVRTAKSLQRIAANPVRR